MATIQEEENLIDYSPKSPTKGGLKTMPFIIVNETLEKVASYGLQPNMVIYLMKGYNLEAVTATSILNIWSALSHGLALLGAFVSDSFFGRFRVVAIGSISSLFGMTILWLTTMIPPLRPLPCDQFEINECNKPTPAQFFVLLFSFGIIAVGAGFVRPCSIAFGADQLDNKENPKNKRIMESYFNWYYATIGMSTLVATTLIVYIQDAFGWQIGFGIPAILMLFSVSAFLLGSPLYIKVNASESLFTGFFQVLVAAVRKRNINLHSANCGNYYHHSPDSEIQALTNSFRCLDKACIIEDPQIDINRDGSASNPWKLCSVEQVESLKSLLRVVPIWSTNIMVQLSLNQFSFSTLQIQTMNRHIFFSDFEIPAGSFSVFMVITLIIWIALYDRVFVPLMARHTGQQGGLSPVLRMGIGLVLSSAALAISAITEAIRRHIAIDQKDIYPQDGPNIASVDMSAMWFVPQYVLLGLADAFNAIGLVEFLYSELPKSMSSFVVAIFTLGMAVSGFFGSLIVNVLDSVTSYGGEISWLSSNINKGHLDYYYWLLAFFNILNFLYFLLICQYNRPQGPS
ncbi:protein NRT1/ PTR FAMILY 1.2-like isoform X1 [Nicotiana sylvestris]|uniref:Protein NRT1/ PTR FAMILY 1.2-like isoform X1 n=1 Tax=Nicotiana sylvestris TaxID=4096 RepID=A0A1U7X4Z6_NICSY|nr:PREDICTED: protein NRT1/ PTR FAMILY 1.2-like isoform X1 [Nicotiana sylvestris]